MRSLRPHELHPSTVLNNLDSARAYSDPGRPHTCIFRLAAMALVAAGWTLGAPGDLVAQDMDPQPGVRAQVGMEPGVQAARMERLEARQALRGARRLPPGEDRDEAVEEAREDVDDAREEHLEARADAREDVLEARSEREEVRQERRASRREARQARWRALRERFDVDHPRALSAPVRAELRTHARRMAKLRRIEALADEADDDANEDRAARLMDRERTRHDQAMSRLQARPGGE